MTPKGRGGQARSARAGLPRRRRIDRRPGV